MWSRSTRMVWSSNRRKRLKAAPRTAGGGPKLRAACTEGAGLARDPRATWSTVPAEGPHGLAVDPETHRLFSAGKNGKLVVLDSVSGKSLGTVDIAEGVDQIAFDPGNKRIYCAAGQGKLTVLQETEAAVKSLGSVATPAGTHTLAVDSNTHSVWIAFAKGEESYVAELKAQ